jgi:hypothetical protein
VANEPQVRCLNDDPLSTGVDRRRRPTGTHLPGRRPRRLRLPL